MKNIDTHFALTLLIREKVMYSRRNEDGSGGEQERARGGNGEG